jgi:hypothetical protein
MSAPTKPIARIVRLGGAWPFPASTDAYKARDPAWFEINEEQYDHMYGALPPIFFKGGFFCSEPANHEYRDGGAIPVYSAFVQRDGRWFTREVAIDRIREAMIQLTYALETEGGAT